MRRALRKGNKHQLASMRHLSRLLSGRYCWRLLSAVVVFVSCLSVGIVLMLSLSDPLIYVPLPNDLHDVRYYKSPRPVHGRRNATRVLPTRQWADGASYNGVFNDVGHGFAAAGVQKTIVDALVKRFKQSRLRRPSQRQHSDNGNLKMASSLIDDSMLVSDRL